MQISPQIILMSLSVSLPDTISVTKRNLICSRSTVTSCLSSPHPFKYTRTMYQSLTVTTNVVTSLFTLIRGFLFCWYYLSPTHPPVHRSAVTVFVDVCCSVSECVREMIICVVKVKTHRSSVDRKFTSMTGASIHSENTFLTLSTSSSGPQQLVTFVFLFACSTISD